MFQVNNYIVTVNTTKYVFQSANFLSMNSDFCHS